MTGLKSLDTLSKALIGFDSIFDTLDQKYINSTTNYPPYNILRIGNSEKYQIQIAVTGFEKSNIEIVVQNQKLTVSGKKTAQPEDSDVYIYRGLATRNFEVSFALTDNIEISEATVKNGLLLIDLVKHIPEEQKPKLIPIA